MELSRLKELLHEAQVTAGWMSPNGKITFCNDHWSGAVELGFEPSLEDDEYETEDDRWEDVYMQAKQNGYVDFIIEDNEILIRAAWDRLMPEQDRSFQRLARERELKIKDRQ